MAQSKYWCFTDFNCGVDYLMWDYEYCIYGVEKCPTTGKMHHQGYVEFSQNHRLSAMKKLDDMIHWEVRKGTAIQARNYCMKEGNFIEDGEMKICTQGKRNDIADLRECIEDGGTMKDVMYMSNLNLPMIKIAESMLTHIEKKRDWVPEVYWFWGPTGSGKTKLAFEMCEDPWVSGRNLKWWQGYDGHENVIFDDFRADFCTFHELLRILDRYPYTLEVKGGSRQLLAKRIIITSHKKPEDIYRTREDVGQLLRRITEIRNVGFGIGMEVQ